MVARPRQEDDGSVIKRLLGIALLLAGYGLMLGAITLLGAAALWLLVLVFWWLREGIWYSYSAMDVLAWVGMAGNGAESATWLGVRKIIMWFLETSLLAVVSTVGGAMTLAGLVAFFAGGYILVRNEKR